MDHEAWRVRIDPASDGIPQQRVTGTYEGLLVCPCRTEQLPLLVRCQ